MGILELFSLKDRVALVTGASHGLGAAFADALAEAGADLVICCRHRNELETTAEAIASHGRQVLSLQSDISREKDVKEMVRRAVDRFGRIDILVNNAATERSNLPPEQTSLEDWTHVMTTNVTGVFLCCREVGRVMVAQRRGKIINIASMSGHIINKYFHGGSYDVSKSAVAALTRALAVEWAPYNITVNALAPGYYETAPNRKWFESNPEIHRKILDMIPLGRLGNIRELSALAVALASEATNYMTGSVVFIDGGYTVW